VSQKIFYVYDRLTDAFIGYVVGTSEEDAAAKASSSLSRPVADLRLADTGKTKPKCCPRR
jgi:hypothetical protein